MSIFCKTTSYSETFRLFAPTSGRRVTRRRKILYGLFGLIVFIILFMLLMGRGNENDDEFNPVANPNIIVGNGPPMEHDIE